jgi:hypothetical protein
LQAVVLDDPFDAAGAHHATCLPQLLPNHLRGRIGVEEAMSDDLSHHVTGPTIVPLGASGLIGQRRGALFEKHRADLEIALPGIAELLCGLDGTEAFTLSFDEHGEFSRHLILVRHAQRTCLTDQRLFPGIKLNHGYLLTIYGER